MRGKVEANLKLFADEKINVRRDFKRKMAQIKKESDDNIVKLGRSLTDEVQFLNQRMKQKLLYQIGLIDEPWRTSNDII